jgi:hypothetical protein
VVSPRFNLVMVMLVGVGCFKAPDEAGARCLEKARCGGYVDTYEANECDGPATRVHCSRTCGTLELVDTKVTREACTVGTVCRGASSQCQPPPIAQEGDPCRQYEGDCVEGLECSQGFCQQSCGGDADCSQGRVCVDQLCVNRCTLWADPAVECGLLGDLRATCEPNREGPSGGHCSWAGLTVVDGDWCSFDRGCAAGQLCSASGCRQVCDQEHPCANGACVPFEGRPYGLCEVPAGTSCEDGDPCGPGLDCVAGRCRALCTADADCDPEYLCVEGSCLQACRRERSGGCPRNHACRPAGARWACGAVNLNRGQCSGFHDCDSVRTCLDGTCQYICRDDRPCYLQKCRAVPDASFSTCR